MNMRYFFVAVIMWKMRHFNLNAFGPLTLGHSVWSQCAINLFACCFYSTLKVFSKCLPVSFRMVRWVWEPRFHCHTHCTIQLSAVQPFNVFIMALVRCNAYNSFLIYWAIIVKNLLCNQNDNSSCNFHSNCFHRFESHQKVLLNKYNAKKRCAIARLQSQREFHYKWQHFNWSCIFHLIWNDAAQLMATYGCSTWQLIARILF